MRREEHLMCAMPEPLGKRAEGGGGTCPRATLATVESCTAGSIAYLLSQAEGASTVLHGGFIVYTKENKTVAVGVPEELLAAHTAMSGEVAQAMAAGRACTLPGRPRRRHYACRRART
jgi:hypothetical protein